MYAIRSYYDRIPDVHEAERTRGIGGHSLHLGATRADRREVIADPAALLHRQRGLLQHVEDAAHRIGDRAHHEAVEQRDGTPGARPRRDPPGRQILESYNFV